ncbi:nSTAND1 domain-containing NTPase [Streptomyces chartreusis]|uniref:nSTAND1 domain-containing NTPase n=1 Tax=Streptomyces chartreusis TaxID=1969 RepID=UPI00365F7801
MPPDDVTFGSELRRLRQANGLSLAALAEKLKTSKGYLSRLERGLQRPSEAFARACDQALGAGGTLLALALESGRGLCPYPGLASFRTEDARWFFGRDRAVTDLLGLLDDPRTTGHPAVLIGPSGIGKSSLLRAGLATAVARGALPERQPGTATTLYITPTARPLQELRSWDERLPSDRYTLLIADQFEELFTLCPDEAERVQFVEELCTRAADGLPVVLGLRADFYGHCLAHPPLLAALRARALPLGPMGPEELRQAIIEPAAAAGLSLEPGLVEVLLRDLGAVGGTGTCEAGALPLLSHALRATWQQRAEGTLTVAGYQRTGGVHGAVATTAERVHGQLSPDQWAIARRLLLNLVRVGDGTDDSRNRVGREELVELTAADVAGVRAEDVRAVVEAFTGARLLTASADHVEISHEALLRAWPRLRQWIDEDRARLKVHQRLAEAARSWQEEGRDDSLLLRGARLAAVSDWLGEQAGTTTVLRPVESEFLRACRTHEETERATERRRNRRLRQLVGGLAVLLVVALASGLLAIQKSGEAVRHTDHARKQEHRAMAALLSSEARRLAVSRPELAALLATAADGHERSPQSAGALLGTQAQGFVGRLPHPGQHAMLWSASLSNDGRFLASSDIAGRALVWDVRHRKLLHRIDDLPENLHAVAMSPDGRRFAGVGEKGSLWLWDVRSGRQLAHTAAGSPGTPALGALEFSRDGTVVAVAGAGVQLRLTDGLKKTDSPASTPRLAGLALHPDSKTIAGAGWDGTVHVWQRSADGFDSAPLRLDAGTEDVFDVDFSRDGALLAAAGRNGTVRLWRTSDWQPAGELKGHSGEVWRLAFRADGRVLASAGEDEQILLWDVQARRRLASLGGHSASVHSVSFSHDGLLASGGSDRTAALWDTMGWLSDGCGTGAEPPQAAAHGSGGLAEARGNAITFHDHGACRTLHMKPGPVHGLARGKELIAAGGDAGTFRVWDTKRGFGKPYKLDPPQDPKSYRYQYGVAVSPDDALLAVGGYSNQIRIWAMTARGPAPLPSRETNGTVRALTFSPDRRTLAIGADRVVEFARLDSTAAAQRFAAFSVPVSALAYGDEGRTLVVGAKDGTVELWDVRTRSRTLTLNTHQGHVRALHFAPGGDRIAVVGDTGSARWWILNADWARRQACRSASAPDPQEWQRLLPDVSRSKVLGDTSCQTR